MHTALKIPELVLMVLDMIEPRLLGGISLVCSSWAPLALSTKWRKSLISFEKFIAIFRRIDRPSSLAANKATSDYPYHWIGRKAPPPISWSEFTLFTHNIQRFVVDTAYNDNGEILEDLSESDIQDIKEHLQGQPLLPNLREVVCWRRELSQMAALQVFEGSNRVETFGAYCMEIAPRNILLSQDGLDWVQMFHDRLALRQRQLYVPFQSPPIDFTRFRRLRRLELHDNNATFNYELWTMLLMCQGLRTLSMTLKTIGQLPPEHPNTSFPFLHSLSVHSSVVPWLLSHSMMPSLSRLIVGGNGLGSADFRNVATHLRQNSPSLEVLHAKLHVEWTFLMDNSIPALLTDSKLRELSLSGVVDTISVPTDRATFILEHWAPLLENLESFGLSARFQQPTGPPVATEETLVAVLKSARRLKKLEVAVDEFSTCRFVRELESEYGGELIPELDRIVMRVVNTISGPESIGALRACFRTYGRSA